MHHSPVRTSHHAPVHHTTHHAPVHHAPSHHVDNSKISESFTHTYGRPSHRNSHVPPPNSHTHVVGTSMGPGRIVEERWVEGHHINTRYEEGESITHGAAPQEHIIQRADLTGYEEEAIIVEEIEEIPVDVIVEQKVPVTRYVDTPYDVRITKQVKKIIEKEMIIERIKEIPIEKIVEFEVEKIVHVPRIEYEEQIVEVERIVDVPVYEIIEDEVAVLNCHSTGNEKVVEVNVAELHDFKKHNHVDQVLETDVRLHTQKKIVEVPEYQVNLIRNVVNVPVYRFHEVIEKTTVPSHVLIEDEIPTYHHDEKTHTREVQVEKPVHQNYSVEHEVARYHHEEVRKEVQTTNTIVKEIPYTTTYEDEAPVYDVHQKEHTVTNIVPVDRFSIHTEEKHVDVPFTTHVPLHEVHCRHREVRVGEPVKVPARIETQDIEYDVVKHRPVPQHQHIPILVPSCRRHEDENIIQVEVPVEVVMEVPVAVEKTVEVEVIKKIE